jgi:hypothetical protein
MEMKFTRIEKISAFWLVMIAYCFVGGCATNESAPARKPVFHMPTEQQELDCTMDGFLAAMLSESRDFGDDKERAILFSRGEIAKMSVAKEPDRLAVVHMRAVVDDLATVVFNIRDIRPDAALHHYRHLCVLRIVRGFGEASDENRLLSITRDCQGRYSHDRSEKPPTKVQQCIFDGATHLFRDITGKNIPIH